MIKNKMAMLYIIPTLLLIAGCYHAKITTGAPSSSEVYENKWAASWIAGLIPPEVVNVEKECTNGVAMVETKHSFLNLLVGGLTASIFTPMHITVTCAGNTMASVRMPDPEQGISISERHTRDDLLTAFQQAADKASQTGMPVYVYF